MNLKLREILAADQQIGALPTLLPEERKERLSVQVAYWAAKNALRMKNELIAFQAANQALFNKYSEQIKPAEGELDQPKERLIPPERLAEAQAELDELLDKDVEFEPYLIKLELLEKDGFTFSIQDMLRIEFLIAAPK